MAAGPQNPFRGRSYVSQSSSVHKDFLVADSDCDDFHCLPRRKLFSWPGDFAGKAIMGLKSRFWFLARALEEERRGPRGSRIHALSVRALDLGLRGTDSTRGHILQAAGAVQVFLARRAGHVAMIRASPPNQVYQPGSSFLADWQAFLAAKHGPYGRPDFGYNYDTLKGGCPARC